MSILKGSFSKSLMPGVNAWFGASYDEYPPEFKDIFESFTSDKDFEEDVNMYGMSLATVKPEGQAFAYDDMAQGPIKRYTNITIATGFKISREAVEDNKYMSLAEARSKAMAFSMRQTKENIAANVLNRAFSGSYLGADGICLCSASHVMSKGGTFSNTLAVAADLSEASIEQSLIDIANMKNDAGLRIRVMPKKLIIPPDLMFDANRILNSPNQNDTANNAINALKGLIPGGVAVNHFLTDTDAFFITTNIPDGLKHFQRRALAVEDDTDFESEDVKYKATERYCFGWSDARGIYGSPGA